MRIPEEKKDYFYFTQFWSYLYKAWNENYDQEKEDFDDEFEKFCTYTAREMVQKWLAKKEERNAVIKKILKKEG